MDYNEFEDKVNYLYQRDGQKRGYEFVADIEGTNDTCILYDGIKKECLDNYDAEKLEQFRFGDIPNYMARILLQDMVNNKALPEGNYLIRISW